jgi:hypothetical protein
MITTTNITTCMRQKKTKQDKEKEDEEKEKILFNGHET